MENRLKIFILVGILTVCNRPAQSQISDNIRLIGRWAHGPCEATAIVGEYAYMANGAALQIINISDVQNPVLTGELVLPEPIKDIALQGDFAYIADFQSGLQIVDVSNPADPVLTGAFTGAAEATSVGVQGDYAYLADDEAGLRIINVSNPAGPYQEGVYNTPISAQGVAVREDLAFVADGTGGLEIINIANPASPSEEGSVPISGYLQGVALSGDFALVASGTPGLSIVDISNPASPVVVGTFNTPDYANDVAAIGKFAYVADLSQGLRVIDFSDPANPIEAAVYNSPGSAYDVALNGSHVFLADGHQGLSIINTLDLSETSATSFSGDPMDIEVQGDYAYIAAGMDGLQIYNISNPALPTETRHLDLPNWYYCSGLTVEGNYVYMAQSNEGIHIVNIEDPANPYETADYNPYFDNVQDIAVQGNFGYVVYDEGLRILNVSDRSNPTEEGVIDIGWASDIVLRENYAYVAADSGLFIIDISDEDNPLRVGFNDEPQEAKGIALYGNYACVATGNTGAMFVLDISDPANPVRVGQYSTDYSYAVSISGHHALVGTHSSGIRAINISDPSSPYLDDYYTNTSNSYGLTSRGGYAYSGGGSGMQIVQLYDPARVADVVSGDRAEEVLLDGNYLYVADRQAGVFVVDMTDPSTPVDLSHINTRQAYGVAKQGDLLYVADADSGLRIINVVNPANPVPTGFLDTPGSARDVFVQGNYAFVADHNSGMRIINVTNPALPVEEGFLVFPNAREIEVRGDLAYVACSSLRIINVSNKSMPVEEINYSTPGLVYGVSVKGNYAYIADFLSGFRILDVSDPSSPDEVGSVDTDGYAYGVDAKGPYACVADGAEGLRILNISNPSTPIEGGFYNTGFSAHDVTIAGPYLLVSDYNDGVYILQETFPPAEPQNLNIGGMTTSPWQSSPRFTLDWSNPADVSGIAQAKVRINAVPTTNADYDHMISGIPPQDIVTADEGVQPVYIWLVDSAGNDNYLNMANVTVRHDRSINAPVDFSETNGVLNGIWQHAVAQPTFLWSAPDNLSGIAMHLIYIGPQADATTPIDSVSVPQFTATPGEGTSYLRVSVRDSAGNVSDWTTGFTFRYDNTLPQNPDNVSENNSVQTDIWQASVSSPTFTWSGADDAVSGVARYLVYFGRNPAGIPQTSVTTSEFSPPFAENGSDYLRLLTEDHAGNQAAVISPFLFNHDGTPPVNPQTVTDLSGGSQNNVWQNSNDDPNFSWTPAEDSLSGVNTYYYYWGREEDGTTALTTVQAAFNPSSVDTGIYYLRLKTEDNVGNSAPWMTAYIFKFDNVSPGAQGNSPDTSSSTSFTVNWSGASDRGGSGLSGNYNVRVKDGALAWTDWLTDYQGTSAEYSGVQGHTYSFEVSAMDNAGNTEMFSSAAECATIVDTTTADNLAPASPGNLTAAGSSPSPWQNTDHFNLNWSNPPDRSGIESAFYKLETPPEYATDYVSAISPSPPVEVTASREGVQNLYLWLEDGSGNADHTSYATVELRYDGTRPDGCTASSADTVSTLNFTVSWSQGSDLGGSGISGIYNVRVRDGGGPWTDWKIAFEGTESQFSGEHLHTYYFEAAAHDNAGNIEDLIETSECTTHIDTTLDLVAPAAPLNLSAAPSGWSNVNNFSLTWNNPSGDQSIGGVFYKIDSPPEHAADGTYVPGDLSGISNLECPSEGSFSIYVWLEDLLGNFSHLNAASATLNYDATPPSIAHSTLSSSQISQDITISASVTEEISGIARFDLVYRQTGDVSNIVTTPFSAGQAVIPAQANTQRGLEYRVTARDNAQNTSSVPPVGFSTIQAVLADGQGIQTVAQHHGSSSRDYRIFSVPFVLEDKRPSALLEDDLGSFDDTRWKFFDVFENQLRGYNTIRNLSIVEPGKGFLLITSLQEKFIDAGSGQSPNVADHRQISLGSGWNLIGNPFDFDIPLDSLKIDGGIPEAWSFESSGWINNPTHLKRWEGLAVYAESAAILTIGAGGGQGLKFSVSERFQAANWGIRISAYAGGSTDLDNYVGVYSAETAGHRTVWHEPPRLSEAVSLCIKNNLENSAEDILSVPVSDLSTWVQRAKEEGNSWDLELMADGSSEPVQIKFVIYGRIPDTYQLRIVDISSGDTYDLASSGGTLQKRIGSNRKARFRLIVGTEDFVESKIAEIQIIPTEYILNPVFPNPFNPSATLVFGLPEYGKVTIEVFNILGQKVATPVASKPFDAGYHRVRWNGVDDQGNHVASGMYLFRLKAGNNIRLRKGILVR